MEEFPKGSQNEIKQYSWESERSIDYDEIINSGYKSQSVSFKMDLTNRINEAYFCNDSVHFRCLPIFTVVVIHTDNLDFVSGFHVSQ